MTTARLLFPVELPEEDAEDFIDAFRMFMVRTAPNAKYTVNLVVLEDELNGQTAEGTTKTVEE